MIAPHAAVPANLVQDQISYWRRFKTTLQRPVLVEPLVVSVRYTAVRKPRPHWTEKQTGTLKIWLVRTGGQLRVKKFQPLMEDDLMSWKK